MGHRTSQRRRHRRLGSPSGKLGAFSGTIYAPNKHADFGESISGVANLAVITGCIYIDGSISTFDFKPEGLAGFGSSLTE